MFNKFHLFGLAMAALLASGCANSTAPSTETTSAATADGSEVTLAKFNPSEPAISLHVPDMACEENCAKAVAQSLRETPGVTAVEIEFATKTAKVNIDAETFNADSTLAKLAEEGYTSTVVNDTVQ